GERRGGPAGLLPPREDERGCAHRDLRTGNGARGRRRLSMKLTDAGLETVLVFDEGFELPQFAAFPLVDTEDGRAALSRYYRPFLELARDRGVPLVLSAPTWRANSDWGRLLGYEGEELAAVNRRAVAFVEAVRDDVLGPDEREGIMVEACIGP